MVHFWQQTWAPPLSPICLTPHRSSSAVEPIGILEKIERIEINNFVDVGGVVYYILEVYLKHHTNRIPTNKRLELARRDEPDYTIQKRFNEFANLRYQIWNLAQRQHDDGMACSYCGKNWMEFIVTSFSQPRLVVKLLLRGKNLRKKLLAKGINKYVELAIGSKVRRDRLYTCDGYQTIPCLVERFLRQEV